MPTRLHALALLLIAVSSQGAAAVTCTSGDLIRRVTVVYDDPGQPVPCSVLYEKPGQGPSQTLWSAQNEVGYCEDKAQGFVTRLDALGWDCDNADPESSTPGADVAPESTDASPVAEPQGGGRVQKTFLPRDTDD